MTDPKPSITDDQWRLIEPCIPVPRSSPNPRRVSDRAVCTALVLVLLDGVSWDTAAYRCQIGATTLNLRWMDWSTGDVFPKLWRVCCTRTDAVHEWGKRFALAAADYAYQTAERRREASDRKEMRRMAAMITGEPQDLHRIAWNAQCYYDGSSF